MTINFDTPHEMTEARLAGIEERLAILSTPVSSSLVMDSAIVRKQYAAMASLPNDARDLLAEVKRLRFKCGVEAPEGTAIYHVTTKEYVYCPACECEIEDPWDEPGTKNCDGGDWHGVITCCNCEAKIEVHSQLTHFWTARLYTEKEQQP